MNKRQFNKCYKTFLQNREEYYNRMAKRKNISNVDLEEFMEIYLNDSKEIVWEFLDFLTKEKENQLTEDDCQNCGALISKCKCGKFKKEN